MALKMAYPVCSGYIKWDICRSFQGNYDKFDGYCNGNNWVIFAVSLSAKKYYGNVKQIAMPFSINTEDHPDANRYCTTISENTYSRTELISQELP